MWQSGGDDYRANPTSNEVSSAEGQALDEQLLAKILSDHVGPLSGSDKARALIAAHSDLGGVLRAESHRLGLVVPLSDEEMSLLEVMRRAARLVSEREVLKTPVIGSLSALQAYLESSLERDVSPHLQALLLDQRNRLQADVPLKDRDGQDAIMVGRDLTRVALQYGASATIVVQTGKRAATSFEAELINQATITQRSLQDVDIVLHDYVRRSDHGWVSMRASGLLR